MPTPVDIYVVVAQKNRDACEKFEQHLARFINDGVLRVSHRHNVNPGALLDATLRQAFLQARIIVLLRTVQFDSDDRCPQEENWAYQFQGSKTVIPIIVGPHPWNTTRALPTGMAVLPRNESSIEEAGNQDAAWANVAREIYKAVKRLNGLSPTHSYAAPAPQPAQYPQQTLAPRVVVVNQNHVAQPPTTSGPKQNTNSILIKLIGLGLFGFGIYYYAITSLPRETTTAQATIFPTGLLPNPTALVPNQCPSPCCGGSACALNADEMRKLCSDPATPCCPSGRKCVPLACGEKLPANQRYNLRLAHATVNGREPSMGAQICFRRIASGTPRQCVPYSSAHANSKDFRATPPQPIPILLGDVLAGKGIEVQIWEQDLLTVQFTVSHDNIKATALCIGLRLAQPGNPDTKALVFLDDP